MTCQEAIEFLMLYLDGELPAEQHSTFEAHLVECPECVDYLENYRVTIHVSRLASEAQDDPPCIPEPLVQAILATCPRKSGA